MIDLILMHVPLVKYFLPIFNSIPGMIAIWVPMLSFIITVITLFFVVMQFKLMKRQDKIIEQRAELKAIVESDASKKEIIFDAKNIGERGINSFDWHIWVPRAFGGCTLTDIYGSARSSSIEDIDKKEYLHFSGNFRDYIYKTRQKTFANLTSSSNSISGEYTFYAQIICEDGIFPKTIGDDPLTIKIDFQFNKKISA